MPVVPIEDPVFQQYVNEYGTEKEAKKKIKELVREEVMSYDT